MAHRLSCSMACGIFLGQGSNPCPLHWQADSQPLRHLGSPLFFFFFDIVLLVFSFLLSGMTRYARFILCFSCLKSLIRKFSENSWILLLENNIGDRNVHIVGLTVSRPFQWTELRSICIVYTLKIKYFVNSY